MQNIIVSLLLVLLIDLCIDAKAGVRGRGSVIQYSYVYTWDVDLGDGTLVPQKAMALPASNVVNVVTVSRRMKTHNLTPSVMAVNNASGVVVIKTNQPRIPCFITTLNATKQDVVNDFASWNRNTKTLANNITLNATGPHMGRLERKRLFADIPDFARRCRGKRIVKTTPMAADQQIPDTQTVNVLGYDSTISIVLPAPRGRVGNKDQDLSVKKVQKPKSLRRFRGSIVRRRGGRKG